MTADDPFRRWRVSVFVMVATTALTVACLFVIAVVRVVLAVLSQVT